MSIWYRLQRAMESLRPVKRTYHFDDELIQSLQILAKSEQRSEQEIVAELLSSAIDQHHANDEYQRRWRTLTTRQRQVAALTCLDYTNRQIAARLFISPETVKSHIRNALPKLDLHSKAELRQALESWDFSAWQDTEF